MADPYQLSAELRGHESDVRCVCAGANGSIISGSRDGTVRLWAPAESGGYAMTTVFRVSSHFVSAVVYCPPDDVFPEGRVVTGSHDSLIRVHNAKDGALAYSLAGHSKNVSCLAAGAADCLVSGSWDHSARVWRGQDSAHVLQGHSQAVWAVLWLSDAVVVTGSADKTIRMWEEGRCVQAIMAHEDAVRGLALLPGLGFVSCSNDAVVKVWSAEGILQHELHAHTSFVYACCALGQGADVASCGEDRRLCVWRDAALAQSVVHPASSVWCVEALPNGDLVTGSSDAVVRVFTRDASRRLPKEMLESYEQAVAATTLSSSQVGDVLKDVPGPSVLQRDGTKEGQTRLVKQPNGKIECYQWSNNRWECMGEVVNAIGSEQKKLFDGEEYDYVFDVDIGDGQTLKLPYNTADNPYAAAQAFLERNELPADFLDQVANFIMTNTKSQSLAPGPIADPFTGQSAYWSTEGQPTAQHRPPAMESVMGRGSHMAPQRDSAAGGGRGLVPDPFTGPGAWAAGQARAASTFYPQRDYVLFDTAAKVPGLVNKLREFNSTLPADLQVTEGELEAVPTMATDFDERNVGVLTRLLAWPSAMLFPTLDLLRLVVLQLAGAKALAAFEPQLGLMGQLRGLVTSTEGPKANVFLSLRYHANAFRHPETRAAMQRHAPDVLTAIGNLIDNTDRNVSLAAVTVCLNYAVLLATADGQMETKAQALANCACVLGTVVDAEIVFRALVAIGTLVSTDRQMAQCAADLQLKSLVAPHMSSDVQKVKACATDLCQQL